jgi:hypothetical protein
MGLRRRDARKSGRGRNNGFLIVDLPVMGDRPEIVAAKITGRRNKGARRAAPVRSGRFGVRQTRQRHTMQCEDIACKSLIDDASRAQNLRVPRHPLARPISINFLCLGGNHDTLCSGKHKVPSPTAHGDWSCGSLMLTPDRGELRNSGRCCLSFVAAVMVLGQLGRTEPVTAPTGGGNE